MEAIAEAPTSRRQRDRRHHGAIQICPNPYLKKIEPDADFYARLQILIRESAGYIALRGGMGTVTEISYWCGTSW